MAIFVNNKKKNNRKHSPSYIRWQLFPFPLLPNDPKLGTRTVEEWGCVLFLCCTTCTACTARTEGKEVVTNGVRPVFQLHSSFRVCMGTNTIRRRRSPEQRGTGNGLLVFTRGSRVVVWRGTLVLGRRWCHRWILVARRSTIPVFRGHIVVPWVATVRRTTLLVVDFPTIA